MTITGHLDLGTAQIISLKTGAVIGYAYTVENGGGQLQRWLLHQDPENAFQVCSPPSHMANWSLNDWKENVAHLWRPGSFYVRAQANVYLHGSPYNGVTWTTIPASCLPSPEYPQCNAAECFQLDPTGGKILRVHQQTVEGLTKTTGLAYTVNGLHDDTSAEYWMLLASFQPAGKLSAAAIRVGTAALAEDTLDRFVEVANDSWKTGCTFVIAGCRNYQGEQPPAPQDV